MGINNRKFQLILLVIGISLGSYMIALADVLDDISVTGVKLYENACQKTSGLPDLAVDVKLQLTFRESENPMNFSSDILVKYEKKGTEDMKYLLDMMTHFPVSNMNVNKTVFFTDGYLYTNLVGIKFKAPVTVAEMMNEVDGNPVTSPFDRKYLEDVSVQEMGEGSRCISFKVETEEIQGKIGAIYSMFGMGAVAGETVFGDMDDQVVINADGYCLSEELHMPVEQMWQGEKKLADVVISVVYDNPGQAVALQIPSAEGYVQLQDFNGNRRFLR